MFRKSALLLTILTLLNPELVAAQRGARGTAAEGRVLFHSPSLSTNGLACINCHSDFDETREPDGRLRAGHPLYNATMRATYWGQQENDPDRYQSIGDAAVVCVEHFMQNPDKLTARQVESLTEYLKFKSPRPLSEPLALAPAADKTGEYLGHDGGDRIRGRDLFYATCHVCHPNANAGIGVAIPRSKDPTFYAQKVREGDGLGAVLSGLDANAFTLSAGEYMPFFGADRLTKVQLRDIIAYLRSLPAQ
ncbi:MAG: cytochrome c [Gemmatimonadetes bacterium]|nr:cytochrome c [Gemmatimonadota bacterium]MBT5144152.1 cytochrome c [Gemmatimonadota bacterium]MBT5586624.1 cytochrome c [Gemmatimonadota bacterium]MBT5964460.1 cytochrome c [Gemmatimonadota bacterium]MBT6626486.1 cytochrome c [Gemmatimonadota bacterium]